CEATPRRNSLSRSTRPSSSRWPLLSASWPNRARRSTRASSRASGRCSTGSCSTSITRRRSRLRTPGPGPRRTGIMCGSRRRTARWPGRVQFGCNTGSGGGLSWEGPADETVCPTFLAVQGFANRVGQAVSPAGGQFFAQPLVALERELHSELDVARPRRLRGDQPEGRWGRQASSRGSEAGMVEQVEKFRAEIERHPFGHPELLADGCVEVEQRRRLFSADTGVAEQSSRSIAVRAFAIVNPSRAERVARSKPVIDRLGLIRQLAVVIGAHVAADGLVGGIASEDGHWEAGMHHRIEAGLPPAQDQ